VSSIAPFTARPGPIGRRLDRLEGVRPGHAALALYLLALAVALLVGLLSRYRTAPDQLDFDEGEYWQLSSDLLAGRFDVMPRRTMAFPLVLAGLRLLLPGFLAVQVGVTAIYALSAPLLFGLARRLSGRTGVGIVAGALFAVWPPTIFYAVTLYSEPVALPLFLGVLCLLPLGSRSGRAPDGADLRGALAAGLLLAVATQVRTMYLLFLPFALAALLLEEWRFGTGLRRAVVLLLGFAVLTAPWSIYMTRRFGHPILVTANGGETLSGGLGPRLLELGRDTRTNAYDRSTWIGPGKWLSLGQSGYLSPDEVRHLPYDRQDAVLKARTMAWVRAHPLDALGIEACKIAYMWGLYRMGDNGTVQLLFGSLPILALLVVAGAVLARRPVLWGAGPRLWLVPLFVSGVALISWGSWRFRQPADAALIALAAVGWLQSRPGARSER
jgi:hypothetical protein